MQWGKKPQVGEELRMVVLSAISGLVKLYSTWNHTIFFLKKDVYNTHVMLERGEALYHSACKFFNALLKKLQGKDG